MAAGVALTILQVLFFVYPVVYLVGARWGVRLTPLGKPMLAIADDRERAIGFADPI